MRVPEDLWAAVSKFAGERGSNNTAVVVGALRSFLGDAGGGVPELEEGPVPSPPASPRVPGFSPVGVGNVREQVAEMGVRPSPARVSAVTGHREGCGCARCDDVRTGRRG
jgi:hypothetical protein